MIYDLGNPSDPIVFEADDFEVAAVATVVVGGGAYSATPTEEGAPRVPMFMLGGHDEWFIEHLGGPTIESLDRVTKTKNAEVVACLNSFMIGKPEDVEPYKSAMAAIEDSDDWEAYRLERHEARRSSMNDICGYAWDCAQCIADARLEVSR